MQSGEGCDDDGTYAFTLSHSCTDGVDCDYCDASSCTVKTAPVECVYELEEYNGLIWFMGCPVGQLCDVTNNVCVIDYVTFSASEADDYCANLSYAGYDDWLLPNIDHFQNAYRRLSRHRTWQ